jgi:hypothetical protein
VVLFVLGLAPLPLLVYGFGASWQWGGLGALAWAVSLIVKVPVTGSLSVLRASVSEIVTAALSGLISSVSELGVAVLVLFSLPPVTPVVFINLLAFGAGAACLETLFVLTAMFFESPSDDRIARWREGAKSSFCVRHLQGLERLIAFGGHVGARGLICLAIYRPSTAAAVVAFVSFALTDGLAAYGNIRNWDWFKPTTCRRFYGACIVIAAIELTLFAVLSASSS